MAWARVATTNENFQPLAGVEVECFDLDTLAVIQVIETDLGGVAFFDNLPDDQRWFFKVRARRVSTRVQSTLDPARGRTYTGQVRLQILNMSPGSLGKHAVVDKTGHGTHKTIQAAVSYIIATYGPIPALDAYVIHINPGVYQEQVLMALVNGLHIILEAQGAPGTVPLASVGDDFGTIVTIKDALVPTDSPIKVTGYGKLTLRGLYINSNAYSPVTMALTSLGGMVIETCFLKSDLANALTITGTQLRGVLLQNSSFLAGSGSCLGTYTGLEESVNEYSLQAHNCAFRGNTVAALVGATASFVDCVFVADSTATTLLSVTNYSAYLGRLSVVGCRFFLYGDGVNSPNAIGILVQGGSHLICTSTYFQSDRVAAIANREGIRLLAAGDAIIEACRFHRLYRAIYFTGAATVGAIIESNVFAYNTTAIDADAGSVGAACVIGPNVYHNNGTNLDADIPTSALYSSHTLLDGSYHTDTLLGAVVDGDTIIGNVTPKWSRLAISIPAANVRNVFGIDNAELRPSWKTALDATNPADIAAAASPGTSLVFSHRDHVHKHPVFAAGDLHTEYELVGVAAGLIAAHAGLPDVHHAGFIGLTIAGPTNIDPNGGDRITIEDTASVTWASSGAGKIAATAVLTGLTHAILSATHSDTLAAAVARGSLIYGNATPKWAALAVGAAGSGLWTDGTDASWTVSPRYAGYLRVGNAAAPTNVTAGDLNAIRLYVGADAAITANCAVDVTGHTMLYGLCKISDTTRFIDPTGAAGHVAGLSLYHTATAITFDFYELQALMDAAPTADTARTYQAVRFLAQTVAGNVRNFSSGLALVGAVGAAQHLGSGTINGMAGIQVAQYWGLGAGNVSYAYGLYIQNQWTGGSATTVGVLYGINIDAPSKGASGVLTHYVAVNVLGGITTGGLNIGLRLGAFPTAAIAINTDTAASGVIAWGTARDTNLYRSAANILKTDDSLIVGVDFQHLGANIGFFGHAVAARDAAYTVAHVTPDRAYDADATTLDEVADVLGTLITYFISIGLLQ